MRRILPVLLSFVLGLSAFCRADTLKVSAAVSLKESLEEIAKDYETSSGDHVEFVFGASGQLATQIKSGAPVDLFISAANKQVDDLIKSGDLVESTRHVVCGNELVLIVPADSKAGLKSFADLGGASVAKVGIGEPKTVPAGQYAMQVLDKLKLSDALQDKIVYGASVRQVLAYVESGEVTAGIVYATDAKQSGEKVHVIATADADTHEPIVYPAAVVKASGKQEAAGKFLKYLTDEKAQGVLKSHGFSAPK